MTENEFPSLQDLPSEARVLVISPSYRQVSRRRNAHRVMLDTPQVRRYPLFSSPDNQIGGTEEQDQDSQQSPVSPPPPPDEPQREEEEEVSTYFEEQDSIEDILEEIQDIENTILDEGLASIVQLRTVKVSGVGHEDKVSDGDAEVATGDGNIEQSFDLRSTS